jgi:fermentation-respiration switch protein FrsA (DUF1100 family)
VRCTRLLAGLLSIAMLTGCGKLLFYPLPQLVRTPAELGLEYRDIELQAADGAKLHGWWLESQGPARGTVFFLHGNAENISTHIGSVHWLPAEGYRVLLLDYRGYGRSGGKPRLPDVFQDIEAGFAWLVAQPGVRDGPLFLFGQSLGGALGGYFVGAHPEIREYLDGVVLDAAIARYSWIARDVAAQSWLTWPFQWPIAWTMPKGYDLLDVVGAISPLPLLVIHGTADEIVPYRHGQALFAAAREPKSFLSYDGPHIGTFADVGNRRHFLDFLAVSAATRVDRQPARPGGGLDESHSYPRDDWPLQAPR